MTNHAVASHSCLQLSRSVANACSKTKTGIRAESCSGSAGNRRPRPRAGRKECKRLLPPTETLFKAGDLSPLYPKDKQGRECRFEVEAAGDTAGCRAVATGCCRSTREVSGAAGGSKTLIYSLEPVSRRVGPKKANGLMYPLMFKMRLFIKRAVARGELRLKIIFVCGIAAR